MIASCFKVPPMIAFLSTQLIYETGVPKTLLYKKAIEYFFEHDKGITKKVMCSSEKRTEKEQAYIPDDQKKEIKQYLEKHKDVLIAYGKPKRVSITTFLIQALIEYYYYEATRLEKQSIGIATGLRYIVVDDLLWKGDEY